MNICYTQRGLGTFATEDKKMIDEIKDEMAKRYRGTFVDEMNRLGYDKKK